MSTEEKVDKTKDESQNLPKLANDEKVEHVKKTIKGNQVQKQRYQPKLMLEEDETAKTVLIKIGMRTSTRQIINFALARVKNDWRITLNAFQMDMTKALQAAEIIKTRQPFLHQENKLLSYQATHKVEQAEKPATERNIIRTGISITLSREYFDVEDKSGYQKPKPRQFVQPLPRNSKKDEKPEPPKEDLRKRKNQENNKRRVKKDQTHSEEKKPQSEDRIKPHDRNEEKKVQRKKRIDKEEKYYSSDRDQTFDNIYNRYRDEEDRFYHPNPHAQRNGRQDPPPSYYTDHRPYYQNSYRQRDFDDRRISSAEYRDRNHDREVNGFRGGRDREQNGFRGGRDRDQNGFRGAYGHMRGGSRGGYRTGQPFARGGARQSFDRQGPPRQAGNDRYKNHLGDGVTVGGFRDDNERPARPGYYIGNRQFRMDKIRDQPLEKLHSRANDEIDREHQDRMQRQKHRDQRNRPAVDKNAQK